MHGQYGHWQQHRGLGGTIGTPGGGWQGSLFADGPRVFASPLGEPLGRESREMVMSAGPIGLGQATALGRAVPFGVAPWGFVPMGFGASSVPAEQMATATQSGGGGLAQTLTDLAPTISTIVEATQNPVKRYEVAKAHLRNAEARGAPEAHLNILRAKVRAFAAQAGLKEESVLATRQWRTLGQTASVVGIAVGGALFFFVIVKALSEGGKRPRAVANPRRRRNRRRRHSRSRR